eukprot:TRINITY_DN19985_c0_g1_i2.p1 TRINITY_DN19985_c0_g1~~TRINITY_DN19985_c0_g1_i2.p1  ORF type:complete len:213 (-),score=36.85 TRINITY_DN19985_c0_g1_i2:97-735(-)
MSRMRHSPYDLQVQMEGCDVLSKTETHRLHALGAMDLILQVMRDLPTSAELQACCCRNMERLTADKERHLTYSGQEASKLLLMAMQRHRLISSIQRHGVAALSNMATSNVGSIEIGGLENIEIMLDALRAHPQGDVLQAKHKFVLQLRAADDGASLMAEFVEKEIGMQGAALLAILCYVCFRWWPRIRHFVVPFSICAGTVVATIFVTFFFA